MSPSSRESNQAQLREALAQLNSELLLSISERRAICIKIQEFREIEGGLSSYDPAREKEVFSLHLTQLKELTVKEILAFSLILEDQGQALAPGSYPNWSQRVHLLNHQGQIYEMLNPLMLKYRSPELFSKLELTSEFSFLKDF